MPQYLKRDAVRLFAGSTECLSVALMTLGLPVGGDGYLLGKSHVSGTGLLGVTIELALSACLVQGSGITSLERSPGQFKSAAEILDDFRTLVREGKVNAAFLVAGVSDPQEHSKKLLTASADLKRLATVRAAALHGGVGLPRDACLIEAHRVADFLSLLAASDRIRPYLADVRRPPDPPVDRNVLLDELVRALRPGPQSSSTATSLIALLPGLPSEQPEWFETLNQCVTAPRELNVPLLLSAMDAIPTTLQKAGGTQNVMRVRVDQTNPNAIPIRPEDLKSELSHLRERWGASRGVANGHLNSASRVALPSQDDVREAFSVGLEASGILGQGINLGPHEAWPFVASSLEAQGTPGPYWFILRRTSDLGQTRAQLEKVAKRNRWKTTRLEEVVSGIAALQKQEAHDVPKDIQSWQKSAEAYRSRLGTKLKGHALGGKALPPDLAASVLEAEAEAIPVGEVIASVLAANLEKGARRYWARILCECATEIEDLPALCKVLQDGNLDAAHTAARKALRWIDYASHGPPILATKAT